MIARLWPSFPRHQVRTTIQNRLAAPNIYTLPWSRYRVNECLPMYCHQKLPGMIKGTPQGIKTPLLHCYGCRTCEKEGQFHCRLGICPTCQEDMGRYDGEERLTTFVASLTPPPALPHPALNNSSLHHSFHANCSGWSEDR